MTRRTRKKGKRFDLKSPIHDTAAAGKKGASPEAGAVAVEATRAEEAAGKLKTMPVLGGPAVLGILPEELTGKEAAALKEERDLSGSPAENRRRNAALDERTSLSGRQAAAEVQFEGPTVPAAAAAADNH